MKKNVVAICLMSVLLGAGAENQPVNRSQAIRRDGLEKTPWLIVSSQKGETVLDTENARTGKSCCLLVNSICRWGTRIQADFGETFEFEVYAKGQGSLSLGAFLYPGGEIVKLKDKETYPLTDDYQRYSYTFTCPVYTKDILVNLATDGKVYFDDAAIYQIRDEAFSLKAKPGYQMIANTPAPVKFILTHNGEPVMGAKIDTLSEDGFVVGTHADSGQSARGYIQQVPEETMANFVAAADKIKHDIPAKILYLGDSLTDFDRGYNHADIVDYFLGEDVEVYNFAVRGDDIQRIVGRLNGDKTRVPFKERFDGIFDRQYDIAFVFLGHNDTKASSQKNYTEAQITPERQRALYKNLIERLQEAGVKRIVLMSPSSSNFELCLKASERASKKIHNRFGEPKHLEAFDAVLQELAEKYGLEHLDVYYPTLQHPNKAELFNPNDGVHLSVSGHQVIALETLRYLATRAFP